MTVTVDLLRNADAEDYEAFLRDDPRSLIHYSLRYRAFLSSILAGGESRYLVAREAGSIVGALPLFIKKNPRHGNIVNSLPFYGSHGGPLLRPGLRDPETVGKALIAEYFTLAKESSAVATTLIDSPFSSSAEFFPSDRGRVLSDERIGQLTELPLTPRGEPELEEALFARFHQKTRNSIRKGMKSGLDVSHDGSAETLDFLARLHRQNISDVRGLAKPLEVFRAIAESFSYDRDYRVYLARKDGAPIAGLLVFYYNRTAEYFTPATDPAHRDLQPMSVLISEAMLEAVRRSCLYWNWGGTWKSQEGVYQFKKRWGTNDWRYRYHIDVFDPAILSLGRHELIASYPYFYVVPFDELSSQSSPE